MMIVVTGLQRSGTSMLMNVLEAGGVETFKDDERRLGLKPEWVNPNGFFESDAALRSPVKALSPIADQPFAVKLFYSQLEKIITQGVLPERVLITSRPVKESLVSWSQAFPEYGPLDKERYQDRRVRVVEALSTLQIPFLDVSFHELIDHPSEQASRIANFIGGELDVVAMAGVPRPEFRHYGLPLATEKCST